VGSRKSVKAQGGAFRTEIFMNRKMMSRQYVRCTALAGLICLGSAMAGQAVASCSRFDSPGPSAPMEDTQVRPTAGGFMSAVYRPGAEGFIKVFDEDRHEASVVGMWRVKFVSDGTAYPAYIPPGAVVDFGTQQWHSDGTEFLISGGRAPSTGDVCMGVWEQIGNRTYKLKHIALAYASSDTPPSQHGPVVPAAYVGPGIIRQTVTVSPSGKTFEGTFTIDQYAQDEVTLLQHIAGKIVGTRFTLD
jgi:hypothetical protein